MANRLFVSDSSLIIDLLWKSLFYVDYGSLYWRLYYDFEKAKQVLTESGIEAEDAQVNFAFDLLHKYGCTDAMIIPDIVLFCQIFNYSHKKLVDKKIIKTLDDEWQFVDELMKLTQLFEMLESRDISLDNVQFKFIIDNQNKTISIKNKKLKAKVIKQVLALQADEEINFYNTILKMPDAESVFKSYFHQYGKPSESKTVEKSNVRERAARLLRLYMYYKSICEMNSSIKIITNKGAEFTGKLLAHLGLMDFTEEEFYQDEDIIVKYASYKEYLQKNIRNYLS